LELVWQLVVGENMFECYEKKRSGCLEHHHNIELPNILPYKPSKYDMHNTCVENFQVLKCNVIIEISSHKPTHCAHTSSHLETKL